MKNTSPDISHRLGKLETEIAVWKTVSLLLVLFIIVLTTLAAYLGAQAKTIPWVIEVAEQGEATYYPDAVKLLYDWEPTDTTQRYFLMKYIQNLRGVSIDNNVNQANVLDVYNKSIGEASSMIEDWYYNYSNPLTRSKSEYVLIPSEDIAITSYGDGKWKITWRETTYRRYDKAIIDDNQYEGIFSVDFYTPVTERDKRNNPIGLYISSFDVSLLKNLM